MNNNPKIFVTDFSPNKHREPLTVIAFHKPKIKTYQPSKIKLIENFYDFLQNTSLHGLKFFGDRSLYWIERILFGIAFSIACIGAHYFISQTYRKWTNSPIVISTDTKPTFIDEIPFPAVTICNMNQALKSKVQGINKSSKDYVLLQLACNRYSEIDLTEKNLMRFKSDKDSTIFDFINNITQPCSKMIKQCKFGGEILNCEDIFETVPTDDGTCCLFNGVGFNFLVTPDVADEIAEETDLTKPVPVSWSPEKGYQKNLPKKFFPRRGEGTGVSMGFSVVLDADYKEYYCSVSNGMGFKITIHSPAEIPRVKEVGFGIDVGVESNIEIRPKLMKSTDAIRDINIKFRKCFFNKDATEANNIFRSYTRRNCELHCEAKYLLQKCKCVPFYTSFFLKDRVCKVQDLPCVVNETQYYKTLHNESCSWVCLSGCFDLDYEQDVISTKILNDGTFEIRESFLKNISKDYISKSISLLNFYYEESAFYGQIKQEYIGTTELISNIGGLMGLFLGFSCISIIEVFYYSVLRPICIRFRS